MKTQPVIVSVVAALLAASTGVGFWMWSDTKAELTSTQTELANTEAELANTEAELANTEAELTSVEAELAEIEEVYPLRNFDDRSELVSWREDTGIVGEGLSYVDACLKLQEMGLLDGYILSIDIDVGDYDIYVSLTVIAGENFYMVYPDELEVYLITSVY